MKYLVIFVIMFAQAAFAGPGKFDSSAFNEIIEENKKQERSLQEQLQKSAGIVVPNEKEMGKINAENRVIETTVEQIAVNSSKVLNSSKEELSSAEQDRELMNRISQEVREAFKE